MDNLSIWYLVAICLLACCVIMAFVWIWANKIKNAGVVDIFWSYNFPVIALILLFLADGLPTRKFMICGMVAIAGFRLGTYLLIRVASHLDEEEGRYKQLRKEWVPNPDRKFFWFFQMQAVSNVFLAIPFFIIATNNAPNISTLEYAGAAIWGVGFLGESIADWQLKSFKHDPANKGQVCDSGLWNYSRHPNYFFEWLMWVAYFVFALASPYGYLAIISPAVILYLLFKITGIPMTEEQAVRSKGDLYKAYQQSTSVFVPWFKKS
jgi:steroid 5-alpha reductase family enzyme